MKKYIIKLRGGETLEYKGTGVRWSEQFFTLIEGGRDILIVNRCDIIFIRIANA